MPIEVKLIKCEFCSFTDFASQDSFKSVAEHEKTCKHNPAFKACATCKNWRAYVEDGSLIDACAIQDDINDSDNKADFWFYDHIYRGNCKYWEAAE